MKEETIKNYIKNNQDNSVVFNCKTIESVEKLTTILNQLGIKFENMSLYGDAIKDIMMTAWYTFGKQTCFKIYPNKIVTFSDKPYFKRFGFKPISIR